MKKIGFLGWICQLIVILWALNAGVIGIFKSDALAKVLSLLHITGDIGRIIYIVVGVAGAFLLVDLIFAPKKKA
jgi:uncharacterized membrane protein YuzA (DUF378 family)